MFAKSERQTKQTRKSNAAANVLEKIILPVYQNTNQHAIHLFRRHISNIRTNFIDRSSEIIHYFIMVSAKILRLLLPCVGLAVAASLFAADPILPDLRLTPGVYRQNLTQDQICHTKWGLDKRHVTLAMKKQVFAEYGIPYGRHSDFEVDHLISRELG